MSSFITGLIGIIAMCVALFCAFGAGVETARNKPEAAGVAVVAFLIFALIGIALLLVRS